MRSVNIGFVLYRPGDEPGTLDATWCHAWFGRNDMGSGRATGGPADGFVGSYDVEYFDKNGKAVASFELRIRHGETDYYELEWLENGKLMDVGVGVEVAEGLAAGWRRIDDTPPPAMAEIEDSVNPGY